MHKSISDEAVIKAAKLTGLHDTIMNFENGYDTQCTQELFSQGQWQLLSIARATAANPELLLLDEITANLDANTERDVLTALKVYLKTEQLYQYHTGLRQEQDV